MNWGVGIPRSDNMDLTIYYDGACPLCSREIAFLRRRDRGRGRLRFVDIAAADFDATPLGVAQTELMAQIHGQLADARWLVGMAVLRRAYTAVGLGWLLAPTGWPLLGPLFDAGYRWFARNRLRLTGRSNCSIVCHLDRRR